jgi:putative inorganic carbon (hco3(-)) transporter
MSYLLQEHDELLNEGIRSKRPEKHTRAAKRAVQAKPHDSLRGAYFWLCIFYFVYCARPQDWVPGMQTLPLAKITGILTIASLLASVGKTERELSTLPREAYYLLSMNILCFISAFLSPVWKGGAFFHALDFLKATVAWVLVFLVVTSFRRLRLLVFIQALSVVTVCVVSLIKGHSTPRLGGVLQGIYSNPNEFALAIVLSLPFCFAFFFMARDLFRKTAWAASVVAMLIALLLTASRAGFITLLVVGLVCMWHFAIKGRRLYLIVLGGIIFVLLLVVAGGTLEDRFLAMSGNDLQTRTERSAYGSFEERRYLIMKSIEGIENYPLFGIGIHNFPHYSGIWKDVHVAYLQIGVEGGIPVLVLYMSLFRCGFRKLRQLRRKPSSIAEFGLLGGALHSSLIGFIVGASFTPIAYLYFPYFSVAYAAVLFAIVQEQEKAEQQVKKEPTRNTFIIRNPVGRLEKLRSSSGTSSGGVLR